MNLFCSLLCFKIPSVLFWILKFLEFESNPLIAFSSAQRCCFMRHLRHLCSLDTSRINQTLSLIMRVWVKGGRHGFLLDSPCVNLSVTCVIWRSVNTDYLVDETKVYINFYPAYPQGACVLRKACFSSVSGFSGT